MADTTTPTYGLTKPEVGGSTDTWGDKINGVIDDVEDLLDGTTPVTGIDINSGTIDGVTIGGASAGAGTFTTLQADTSLTVSSTEGTPVDIYRDSTSPVFVKMRNNDGSTYIAAEDYLAFWSGGAADGTGASEKVRIDSSGNVGIGTSSPNAQLEIESADSSSNASLSIRGGSASAQSILYMGDTTNVNVQHIVSDHGDNSIRFHTAAANLGAGERMRIDSSGNVGIGTSSPSAPLTISSTASPAVQVEGNSTITLDTSDAQFPFIGAVGSSNDDLVVGSWGDVIINADVNNNTAQNIIFKEGTTEIMRVASTVMVGKTTSGINETGVEAFTTGALYATRNSNTPLLINRQSTNGALISLRQDGGEEGFIGTNGSNSIYIGSSGVGTSFVRFFNNTMRPATSTGANYDNAMDCGSSVARWDDIYATNTSITTSDRNEKQDIEELSEAEQRVAQACKGLLRKFRWKDSVSEKGDDARIHFGIIAQDLQAAFEAEGLDAGRYAMFISSTWWETQTEVPAVEAQDAVYETQTDEEGNETQVLVSEAVEAEEAYTRTDTYESAEEAPEGAVERTRLGVRYSELLAFIIAAI